MKHNERLALGLAALVTLPAAPALAANGGWIGFAVGQSTIDVSAGDIDDGSFVSADDDNSDNSVRLSGGIALGPNVGVEFSWADFGEATIDAVSNGSGWLYPSGPVSVTAGAKGMGLGLAGYIPLGDRARLAGRAGILMWDVEMEVSLTGGSGSVSEDGNDPYFGVGAEFDLTPALALGATWTTHNEIDTNTLELGLRYRFGQ